MKQIRLRLAIVLSTTLIALPSSVHCEGTNSEAPPLKLRIIPTVRQFSVKLVNELRSVTKVLPNGETITFGPATFRWNEEAERLIQEVVGPLPKGGMIRYEPIWDQVQLRCDQEYYDKLRSYLLSKKLLHIDEKLQEEDAP
jgi:hypothetical protein